MNLDSARTLLLSLPHVAEAEQFGGLIYWLGDKAIGGKMFLHLSLDGGLPIAFPAGPERFAELVEVEGFCPAPYLARAFWVAAERWDVWRNAEWVAQLRDSHALTLGKLPPKTRRLLDQPKAELDRAVLERKKVLAARVAAKRDALRSAQKPAQETSGAASKRPRKLNR